MGIYLCFIIVVILEWILLFPAGKISFSCQISYKQKKRFMILVCLELIILATFRSIDIGADTPVYISALRYYKNIPHGNIMKARLVYPFDFESGYFIFTKICAWLGMSEVSFLFCIASIIYIPICNFIYKYSVDPLLSILIYFSFGCFEYSLGIFRQMIALSIVLLGFRYVQEKKILKYILFVTIAMSFHLTAIIMLPLYWLPNINLKKILKWVWAGELFFMIFSRKIIEYILKIFPQYSGYVNGKYDTQGGTYIMLLVLNIILLMGYCTSLKNENQQDCMLKISNNAVVITIFLQILGYSMGIFGRIVPYYSIFLMLLIPIILKKSFFKNKIYAYLMTTIFLIVMFVIMTNNSYIVPYRTVWNS